jgi:hypothetical protein
MFAQRRPLASRKIVWSFIIWPKTVGTAAGFHAERAARYELTRKVNLWPNRVSGGRQLAAEPLP